MTYFMGKSCVDLYGHFPDGALTWEFGSSDWTRTSNPAINSRMLCQLSYGGSLVAGRAPAQRRQL